MRMYCSGLALLTFTAMSLTLLGQASGSAEKKNASSDSSTTEYSANLDISHKSGRSAYGDEMTREKRGECPSARTTYEINKCLSEEVGKTTSNYKIYVAALRSVEAPEDESKAREPRVKALTRSEFLKEFDAVESAWNAYSKAQCSAAYDA